MAGFVLLTDLLQHWFRKYGSQCPLTIPYYITNSNYNEQQFNYTHAKSGVLCPQLEQNGPSGSVMHQLTKYSFPCKPVPTPYMFLTRSFVPATIISQTLYTNFHVARLHTSQKYFAWCRQVIIVFHSFHSYKDCPPYNGFLHPKLGYSTCPCLQYHLPSVHGLAMFRSSLPSNSLCFPFYDSPLQCNILPGILCSYPHQRHHFSLITSNILFPTSTVAEWYQFETLLYFLVDILELSIQLQAVHWTVVHLVANFRPPLFFILPKRIPEIFKFT